MSAPQVPIKATYAALIASAIHTSADQRLMLPEIYTYVKENLHFVPAATHDNWKNSVRHNLSLRSCFIKNTRYTPDGKKLSAYWSLGDHSLLPIAAREAVEQFDVFGSIKFDDTVCIPPSSQSSSSPLRQPLSPVDSDHSSGVHLDEAEEPATPATKSKQQRQQEQVKQAQPIPSVPMFNIPFYPPMSYFPPVSNIDMLYTPYMGSVPAGKATKPQQPASVLANRSPYFLPPQPTPFNPSMQQLMFGTPNPASNPLGLLVLACNMMSS